MRLGTAIERLVENYIYASDKEWIQDKVAWALYRTWKEADDRKDEPQYDLGAYSDRLWKIAYERGRREALEQTEPQTNADQHVQYVESVGSVDCKTEPQTERDE